MTTRDRVLAYLGSVLAALTIGAVAAVLWDPPDWALGIAVLTLFYIFRLEDRLKERLP